MGWANSGSPEPEGSTVASETGEMAKAAGPAAAIAVPWQACWQKVPQQPSPSRCSDSRTSGPSGELSASWQEARALSRTACDALHG